MALVQRRHEVYRAWMALVNHVRVDVPDGLADPWELKPYPLFVVVVLELLA